jgi:tetratricopeptide (TPR) repeat protein
MPINITLPFFQSSKMVVKYLSMIGKNILYLGFVIIVLTSCSKNGPDFYFKNGNAKYQLKDYSGAIKDFDIAIEKEPTFMQAYHTRAICYGELKKYDKSLHDFNKTIDLDPKFKNAYLNRAYYVKINTGDFAGAIEDYNKFIELNEDGNNAFALNNRGFARFKMNNIAEALSDIESSIKIDSTNSFAFRNRALIYISLDSLNLACKDLTKAVDLGFTKTYSKEVEELIYKYCNNN